MTSRLIHLSLGGVYTHASIAITPETDRLFSFARRTLHNPFNAGFIIEDTNELVFAKYPESKCSVYSLEVTDEAYLEMEKVLSFFIENEKRFSYNFLGTIPSRLGIRWARKYRFTCSQFVAYVLEQSNAAKLPKHYSLMMPNDFLAVKEMRLIYEGTIGKCDMSQAVSVESTK